MKFKLPKASDPGFLRRKQEFQKVLVASQFSDEEFQAYVEYLAQYIEAEDPVEAVLDLSKDDLSMMYAALLRGEEVLPEAGGNSSGG